MATTPDDDDLRTRLSGEPGVTPEDTRSELLADIETQTLRNRVRGDLDIAPEDTRSELLDREERLAEQRRQREAREAATEEKDDRKAAAFAAPTEGQRDQSVPGGTVVEPAPPGTESIDAQAETARRALDQQLADDLRRRKAREQELASQGVNTVDVQRTGRELDRGDFIMPRRITQSYTEQDGKFYAKDSNRVMFEDRGDKLATSSTDKKAIEDMVALAKAKQWESLKLSGSQEFRREAWLQAESQGIKTQGYTPKQADLAALETLRQERSTNVITPLQERRAERPAPTQAAPRHDLNKNQAAMHAEASKNVTANIETLRKQPGMADKSVEDLTRLAYWRGIVAEENKLQAKPVQDEALARFDKQAVDPQFLKRLDQETGATIQEKTTERAQQRDTHEQSL